MRKAFKIFNPDTKLYSAGGTIPRFTEYGRIWDRENLLSNHIYSVKDDAYKNCLIVEVEIKEEKTGLVLKVSDYGTKRIEAYRQGNGKRVNILDKMEPKAPSWI